MNSSKEKKTVEAQVPPTSDHSAPSDFRSKIIRAQSILNIAALALDNPSAVFEHGKNSYAMEEVLLEAEELLSDALGLLEGVEPEARPMA